jgi:hypothetical protein
LSHRQILERDIEAFAEMLEFSNEAGKLILERDIEAFTEMLEFLED